MNDSSSSEARTVHTKATASEAVVSSAVQLLATLRPPISPVKQFCPEQVRAQWLSGAIPPAHHTLDFPHKHCCFQGPCCLQEAPRGHLNSITAQGVGLAQEPSEMEAGVSGARQKEYRSRKRVRQRARWRKTTAAKPPRRPASAATNVKSPFSVLIARHERLCRVALVRESLQSRETLDRKNTEAEKSETESQVEEDHC